MIRDVGRMGEACFRSWCASLGLAANSSVEVDKTGWDFLVEFDFKNESIPGISLIHHGAIECKVQVKSTDKRGRKLDIKLSNLKRLITTSVPAFIVFIEFDGLEAPQRVFLVHVDKSMSSAVLSRLHDADRKGQNDRIHRKMMSIRYDDTHLLPEVSGSALATAIRDHVGLSIESYVGEKIKHAATAGFDDGFAEMTFTVNSEDTIQKLIDVSLGLASEAEVSNVEATLRRFGKRGSKPFMKHETLMIGIDAQPRFEGNVKFKLDKLGSSFSLPGKLYISEFSGSAPEHMRKMRLKADFFDLIFNPYTNAATHTFSVPGEAIPIRRLRDGLRLRKTLSNADQSLYVELDMPPLPSFNFIAKGHGHPFDLQAALDATEAGLRIIASSDISNDVKISLAEATHRSAQILELEQMLLPDFGDFKFVFTLPSGTPALIKDTACLMFYYARIGNVMVGAFIIVIGQTLPTDDGGYIVLPREKIIEKVLVREHGEKIDPADLVAASTNIRKKYEADYTVASLIDEGDFRKGDALNTDQAASIQGNL